MLTINLNDDLKKRLQQQAENNGLSLEEEIIKILYIALTKENPTNLADSIQNRFAKLEDFELPEIPRDSIKRNKDD